MFLVPATVRLGALLLLTAFPSSVELKLKESDHKKLSQLVGAYFTALEQEKGLAEAMQKIIDHVESTEKRMRGETLLASVGDWEQVFRLATESRLKETLKKKGEVATGKLGDLTVAYSVPKKAKGALPLVLVACDQGEAPAAHLDTHWNDPLVREGAILIAMDLGGEAQSWGVFGSDGEPGGTYRVMSALGEIQKQFPVDHNRRYLVGSGKGFAAVEITATCFPHLFAGVIGVGDVACADANNLENFRALPTLILRGGEGAKAMETKLGELGFANCKLEPEGGVAQAWEWIGKTPRNSYPGHVTYAPKDDRARSAYWLSLDGFQAAESPRVEAKVDKATNTITIDATKIADLVVNLNDEIVDLGKPVKLVVNGTTHEAKLERNAVEMIRTQFWGGDWGRVSTASVSQDVPAK